MKNPDFSVKILLQKCQTDIWKKISNIVVPLFGAAYAAPNKGT